jgi:GntR family histidine utilization transcriptional repressor
VAGDRPFALEDRLISLAAVPEAADLDFAEESPGAWLLHHVPWTEAENRISAVGADAAVAELLAWTPARPAGGRAAHLAGGRAGDLGAPAVPGRGLRPGGALRAGAG